MALRVVQPSLTGGEIAPALYARTDLAKYASSVKRAINTYIHPHGGMSNRPGTEFLGEVKDSLLPTVLIPFQFSVDDTYVIEAGNGYFRFMRDGVPVLNPDGSRYEVETPYAWTDLGELSFVQEADIMFFFHQDVAPCQMSRYGETDWRFALVAFTATIGPPPVIQAADVIHDTHQEGQTYRPKAYTYAISSISAANGEESLPGYSNAVINDLALQSNKNLVQWQPVSGAEAYVVYKNQAGVFGYIGRTDGTFFYDENIIEDRSDTPQKGRNPFDGDGKWPRTGTFFEQRLALGGSRNDPQAVFLSQTGNYRNFGVASPAKASDAITFRLRSKQVNRVHALIAAKTLLMLTSASEWSIAGGGETGTLTPANPVIRPQSYWGASTTPPIAVGNVILFPQGRGGVVRDFSYDFSSDGYTGNDLTLLARHLFEGRKIVSWAYSQSPHSLVYVVMDDGQLLTLTYLKEHEIWGWTQCQTTGIVEWVTVVTEGDEDVPYLVVRRNVSGTDRRYVERLHPRRVDDIKEAVFLDCSASYRGAPANRISGLEYLEGALVYALADGNVVRNLTVQNGAVVLPNKMRASTIHIGLPYSSLIETLDLDLGSLRDIGSIQGRFKGFSQVVLRVQDTRGIFVGPKDDSSLIEFRQRQLEAWSDPIVPFTGLVEVATMWNAGVGGGVVIRQDDPLPMTILSVAPDWSIYG